MQLRHLRDLAKEVKLVSGCKALWYEPTFVSLSLMACGLIQVTPRSSKGLQRMMMGYHCALGSSNLGLPLLQSR